jgi:GNAT superfamily N-acetyltransferase
MKLPDCPPDLVFDPLVKDDANREWAFNVKKLAIGPHVEARWPWEDEVQRGHHASQFALRDVHAITQAGELVGTIAMTDCVSHIALDDFYVLPPHQNRGLGGRVLEHVVSATGWRDLPIRLQVLKWNPADRFYRRHAFVEVGATDVHFLLRRAWSME